MSDKKTFHDALSTLLGAKLAPFKERDLDKATCTEIYTTIFETLTELLKTAKAPLGNESANYIAQSYYEGIKINGTSELDPSIFDKQASVKEIPTKELAFLATLLVGTDFRLPALAEIKQRS